MRKALPGMVLLSLLAGCLPDRVALTPRVSGSVSRSGTPLAGVHVRLVVQNSERGAEAVSDVDGRFELPPLSELAMTTSLLHDSSYGFVLDLAGADGDFPGLALTEQGFPPPLLLLDCDLDRPQGLGGDLHYCRRR